MLNTESPETLIEVVIADLINYKKECGDFKFDEEDEPYNEMHSALLDLHRCCNKKSSADQELIRVCNQATCQDDTGLFTSPPWKLKAAGKDCIILQKDNETYGDCELKFLKNDTKYALAKYALVKAQVGSEIFETNNPVYKYDEEFSDMLAYFYLKGHFADKLISLGLEWKNPRIQTLLPYLGTIPHLNTFHSTMLKYNNRYPSNDCYISVENDKPVVASDLFSVTPLGQQKKEQNASALCVVVHNNSIHAEFHVLESDLQLATLTVDGVHQSTEKYKKLGFLPLSLIQSICCGFKWNFDIYDE